LEPQFTSSVNWVYVSEEDGERWFMEGLEPGVLCQQAGYGDSSPSRGPQLQLPSLSPSFFQSFDAILEALSRGEPVDLSGLPPPPGKDTSLPDGLAKFWLMLLSHWSGLRTGQSWVGGRGSPSKPFTSLDLSVPRPPVLRAPITNTAASNTCLGTCLIR
jgi:hypothetical protein